MQLYAGNLNYNLDSDSLKDLFSPYGEVTSSKVITDYETGRSKGFGFVEMADKGEALNAMKELDGKEIDGRTIRVNEAREKSSGGGGGGGRDRW